MAKHKSLDVQLAELLADLARAKARFAETSAMVELLIKFIFFPFLVALVIGCIYYVVFII